MIKTRVATSYTLIFLFLVCLIRVNRFLWFNSCYCTTLKYFVIGTTCAVALVAPLTECTTTMTRLSRSFFFLSYRYRKCSRQLPSWRPPMSPTGGGKSMQKRARSVEGLLETTASAEPDAPQAPTKVQMKKAKSLEEYLDTCDDDDDDCSVSASVSDHAKKRNFVDKCINKMKSFITASKKTRTGESNQ